MSASFAYENDNYGTIPIKTVSESLYSNHSNTQSSQITSSQYSSIGKGDYSSITLKLPGVEMTTPTREEIDAKLATVDARAETRFVELSGKIDRIIDVVDRYSAELQDVNRRIADENKTTRDTIAAENKTTRYTIVGAIVAGILTGLAALWVTQSNMLASFQAGLSVHDISSRSPPSKP